MKLERLTVPNQNTNLHQLEQGFLNMSKIFKTESKKPGFASKKRRLAQNTAIAGILSDVCKNLQLLE